MVYKGTTLYKFIELVTARDELINEIYKAFRIPQIVQWLANRLK